MKIIIETSESERVALQPQTQAMLGQGAASSMAELVAVDAGPPSEALLQSLSNRGEPSAFAGDGEGDAGYQGMVMDGDGASLSRH